MTAVDGFGDADTRAACAQYRLAKGLSPSELANAAREPLSDRNTIWIYGAGFESQPQHLLSLARHNRQLVGNEPSIMQLLAEPARFFGLLDELGIAYPESELGPLEVGPGWLYKPAGGSGGLGIHRCTAGSPRVADVAGYCQRFVSGRLLSLLFVADGASLEVIGFNRVMARYPLAGDFRFAGVIGGLMPDEAVKRGMLVAARRLTRALGLRGVNGIDFVIHQGRPLLIDLNVRPTAALELYEDALPGGGLRCHLDGCQGRLTATPQPRMNRGMRVLYAREPLSVTRTQWPAWVTDRPQPGTHVAAEQPVCSVHAKGADPETVEARLRERVDTVRHLLAERNEHAA